MKNKNAQNEMFGFAIILVIVSVGLIMFLVVSSQKSSDDFIESFEVEGFIQSFLEYTTDCADGYEPNYLSLRKVMTKCLNGGMCYSEGVPKNPCDVFEKTAQGLVESSWDVGEGKLRSGYVLNITDKGEEFFSLVGGNTSVNSKGSIQSFEGGIDVVFVVYG